MTRIVPKPVTRSKGGFRRKPRRITPFVIENYWPGGQRVAALRRHWGSYKPFWEVVDRINRFPAPKPVTQWQCWLMASHLGLRRPSDIQKMTKVFTDIGPETGALRVRNRGQSPGANDHYKYDPVRPEHEGKLRKVGRKPKPPKPKKRRTPLPIASVGMSAVGSKSWRLLAAQRSRPVRKRRAKPRKKRSAKA